MRVFVGCEFSGRVREAFRARGHQAISCDLEDTELPGPHIVGDIREQDLSSYDIAIFFPPCTYLCNSGARWIKERGLYKEQEQAIELFMWCINAPVDMIAVENPRGIMSTRYKKPSQEIQPYWFGDPESKTTCLWLKNLPPLVPTEKLSWYNESIHRNLKGKDRSRTFKGIANAMASQWG